jgi:hypothetical protein
MARHVSETGPETTRVEEVSDGTVRSTPPGTAGDRARETVTRPDVRRGPVATPEGREAAREKFGGANAGACFFGWLVAVALTVLLTGVVGAIVAGVGSKAQITQSDAQRSAGTIGVAAAIVLLVVLLVGYYTGGYVAGRMSRFDGARQGVGVWLIGLVVTIVALGLGALFGSQYNVLDRVQVPRLPISTDQLGWGGIITALAVLVGTLLVAVLGGVVGRRYHHRVDRLVHE